MRKIFIKIQQFVDCLMNENIDQIFIDLKNINSIPKKIFCTSLEIANGLRMFFYGLINNAFSQSLIILRQLTEQVCFLDIVSNHQECFDGIELFSKLKFECLRYDMEDDINKKKQYQESNDLVSTMYSNVKKQYPKTKNLSKKDYLDYGWMLEIIDECGVEKLYELSNFEGIKKWRIYLNSIVHNTFSFYQNNHEGQGKMTIESIHLTMLLLESYMCSYHKLTGYNYIINNIDFRDVFNSLFDEFLLLKKGN